MAKFAGKNLLEVWDYRLSTAVPTINNHSGTWVVEIWAKDNPESDIASPLETHDTGIKCVDGDGADKEKIIVCYEWLKSVRDKYSLPDIEKLKPLVKSMRLAEAEFHAALAGRSHHDASVIEASTSHGGSVSGAVKFIDGGKE